MQRRDGRLRARSRVGAGSMVDRRALLRAAGGGAATALAAGLPARARARALAAEALFDAWAGPPITVALARPARLRPETRLLVVMHGVARGARGYRNAWLELAERWGVAIAAPKFDRARFPGAAGYQLGDLGGWDGASHAAIEPLAAWVSEALGIDGRSYDLYGHSAGAQFVHRFLFRRPGARVGRAVAANAGWWMRAAPEIPYPYGFQDAPFSVARAAGALSVPLTVLLGTADRGRDGSLRQTPEAERQGPHRVARGEAFFRAAERFAAARGAAFRWRLAYAEGVGHSNRAIAPFAARILFES